MYELTFTLLRLGYLALLWLFVLSAFLVLRRDLRSRAGNADAKTARLAKKNARAAKRGKSPATAAGGRPTPAPAPPRPTPPTQLVIANGPLVGTPVPLTGSAVLIGRRPDNTLALDDEHVSGRHARIYNQGRQWYLEDLGSTNGTFIGERSDGRLKDGKKVEGVIPVMSGMTIQIGQTLIELRAQ
jgi:hypothetical protein